jgi:TPR repeat protein
MYANGQGVKQDYFKAVKLYKKACDGGVFLGCNNLGVRYINFSFMSGMAFRIATLKKLWKKGVVAELYYLCYLFNVA